MLTEWPVEVYDLCLLYPSLGLNTAAFNHVLQLMKPPQMVDLVCILPDQKRLEAFKLLGQKGLPGPALCLEFLDTLLGNPNASLTAPETEALIGCRPELASALVVSTHVTNQLLDPYHRGRWISLWSLVDMSLGFSCHSQHCFVNNA